MRRTALHIATLVLCMIVSCVTQASAQKLLWSAELVPYFDNREYKYERMTSETLFAARLTPTVGVGFNNHSIVAGVSWIQPMDSRIELSSFKPTLYYRYDTEKFAMSMGMFPRTQLIEPLDDFANTDSLSFFSPNIQGALFQHRSQLGYVEAMVDWRGLPTKTTREAFMIVAQGRINITPWLFAGGAVVVNHLARAKDEPVGAETHVTDNIMLRPYVGVDFSHRTYSVRLAHIALWIPCHPRPRERGYRLVAFTRLCCRPDGRVEILGCTQQVLLRHCCTNTLQLLRQHAISRRKLLRRTLAQPIGHIRIYISQQLYQLLCIYQLPLHTRRMGLATATCGKSIYRPRLQRET